jgi:hypothetical protein
MVIKPIKTESDYERALRRIEVLWDSTKASAESDELDVLATLIEAYEREHYPSSSRYRLLSGYFRSLLRRITPQTPHPRQKLGSAKATLFDS